MATTTTTTTTTTTLKVGILTVSTTASQDPSTDSSEKTLHSVFDANSAPPTLVWEVAETAIGPDDPQVIRDTVVRWTAVSEGENRGVVDLVVTTGGTGFALTDGTPEAVRPLLDKEAPGLVHAMLSASLAITPFAMMARPVAGVRGRTVIITLPGSPKGAKENLEAIIKLLPHACIQAADLTSSRALHSGGTRAVEERAGLPPSTPAPHAHAHAHAHHHHHHHHHAAPRAHTANALGGPVTGRHRSSPYPMLTVADATAIVAREAATAMTEVAPHIVTPRLVGHVLAEDVTATESVPAFRASIVDGYALIHTDGPGTYPVVSVSHASAAAPQPPLTPGHLARITTGAPLPDGATAVVMVEDTALRRSTPDGTEELEVEILPGVQLHPGENVREIGSDIAAGDVALPKGTLISAIGGEIGVLASVGRDHATVHLKPVVGVLSTGDELVGANQGPLPHGAVRDSNRPALLSAIKACGYRAVDLGIVGDAAGALAGALRKAIDGAGVDVVVTTGGVSMGERDLLKPTIEQALAGTIHFGRVAMKPGKPTTFATVPGPGGRKKLFFALPGNPASALVTYHLFVLPALRRMAGIVPAELPTVRVVVEQDVRLDERPEFHRVCVVAGGGADGRLRAWSTGGQRSSRIGSAGGANGVLVLPARGECGGKRRELGVVPRGEVVDAILWGPLGVRASDGL